MIGKPCYAVIIVCAMCLSSLTVSAQQPRSSYISLQKPMRYKDIRYYRGDDIEIRLKGDRKSIKGRVVDFTDTTISVNKSTYSYNELKSVIRRKDVRQDKAIVKASKFLPIIGLGYLALGFINGMILHDEVRVTDSGLRVAAVGVGTGLALRPFVTRRHRIDRKWRLRVMDMGVRPQ